MGVRSFDLILLDIMLPGKDGLELCCELRELTFCPIIFLSCLSDDETVIRALNMGGDNYSGPAWETCGPFLSTSPICAKKSRTIPPGPGISAPICTTAIFSRPHPGLPLFLNKEG